MDEERERRIVGFGALALLAFLSVGPTVLRVAAHTAASLTPAPQAVPEPRSSVTYIAAPQDVSDASAPAASLAPAHAAEAPQPLAVPPLTFLFPQAAAVSASPVSVAVRLESATAVAMLFEVTDPAGLKVATLSASPSLTNEWSALFTAASGTYVVSVRASLEDGRVVAFKEQRAFSVTPPEASAAPADPSEPVAELLSPDSEAAHDGIAPLAARVKNAQPNALVFLVTDAFGNETLVLGSEASASGYWTAMFEGPDGTYRARVRATVGEREVYSPETAFDLKAARD